MLYRILTERKNKEEVAAIMTQHFDGFTLLEGVGYWERRAEPSLIVEVETDKQETVTRAALAIKQHNAQEAVMIQRIANHAWLI